MRKMIYKPVGLVVFVTGIAMALLLVSARETGIVSASSTDFSHGGLAVFIGGAEDIAPAESLVNSGPWTIHWLNADQSAVEAARGKLHTKGLYGRISVEHWKEEHLPYADNLVTLIIILDDETEADREELRRVLAPGGIIRLPQGDGSEHIEKSRPEEMGEWTHPWQDSTGNLVASDRAFEPPNAFQWVTGPTFPLGGRKDSTSAIVSAGGRVFSITRNVSENLYGGGPNYLVARDAFNGIKLWSRRWEGPTRGDHEAYTQTIAVASDTRVYGVQGNEVIVLDAAGGQEVKSLSMDSRPDKIVKSGDMLVAQSRDGLTAFDAAELEKMWHYKTDGTPWSLLADDGRAFCLTEKREESGRMYHEVTAVDMSDGDELWRQPVESEYGPRATAGMKLHFTGAGIVTLIERYDLRALSVEDGQELWRRRSRAQSRGGYDSRQVGHMLVDGKVWLRDKDWVNLWRGSIGTEGFREGEENQSLWGELETSFDPETWLMLDPLTGEVKRELEVEAGGGRQGIKHVCQSLTATERFVVDGWPSRAWDFETGQPSSWEFARGGCTVGVIVANGLGYLPSNACGCLDEQLRGNMAIVHSRDEGLDSIDPGEIQRGPAYGEDMERAGEDGSPDWPMYRSDGRRSAYLSELISANLTEAWKSEFDSQGADYGEEWRLHLGRRLTAPVISEGLVLFAAPQTHQVIALDENTGAERWRFTAGGRVTVPPAFYRGMALFGAHDGYVYALRASDGELAWRRRAAPSERRIMAYGQIESAWPVSGGVLVHEGLALVAAGRTVDAGGGLVVHALEPETGEVQWSRRLNEARFGVCEPLVTDGEYAYLMNKRLNVHTGEVTALRTEDYEFGDTNQRALYPEGVAYLRGGKTGLLDNSWTRLGGMARRKNQSTWTWGDGVKGEMIASEGDKAYVYQHRGRIRVRTLESGDSRRFGLDGRQVEAMLVTEDSLFLAGPENPSEPEGPGFLLALSREDGSELMEFELQSGPVYDGIAAANRRVFLALNNGNVLCLEAK